MSAQIHSLGLWGTIRSIPGCLETGRWLTTVPFDHDARLELFEDGLRSGRYNPPQSFPVLYLASDDEACRSTINGLSLEPEVLNVRLSRVLDLCDQSVRKALGVTLKDLTSTEDMSLTQTIGVAARQAGFDGIIYARPGRHRARNLAVILDRVTTGELVPAA